MNKYDALEQTMQHTYIVPTNLWVFLATRREVLFPVSAVLSISISELVRLRLLMAAKFSWNVFWRFQGY
jgi:hypothetical protein